MPYNVNAAFELACERYAELGVDVKKALEILDSIPVSLHCWQGDDVGGFEVTEAGGSGGGIQATGNHPGKARNIGELRADLEQTIKYIPGPLKLNLHAIYLESDKPVGRDEIAPEHFSGWVDWAKANDMGLDFNGSFFAHPKSDLTLSSPDDSIRKFWIDHAVASRNIAEYFGKELGKKCAINLWIPDGSKDTPADLMAPRQRLKDSLDVIFKNELDEKAIFEAMECKLFGIGSESYVVGSHEFYMGYALKNNKGLCLDTGHFHPTESVADKISSSLLYVNEILLHLSRGVRWDSDHVLTLTEEVLAIGRQIAQFHERIHVGLDFFDASINRPCAWAIGARNAKKAILYGLLMPQKKLLEAENSGNFGARLALLEETKTLPLGAIWDHYCQKNNTPDGINWMEDAMKYERDVLLKRS